MSTDNNKPSTPLTEKIVMGALVQLISKRKGDYETLIEMYEKFASIVADRYAKVRDDMIAVMGEEDFNEVFVTLRGNASDNIYLLPQNTTSKNTISRSEYVPTSAVCIGALASYDGKVASLLNETFPTVIAKVSVGLYVSGRNYYVVRGDATVNKETFHTFVKMVDEFNKWLSTTEYAFAKLLSQCDGNRTVEDVVSAYPDFSKLLVDVGVSK